MGPGQQVTVFKIKLTVTNSSGSRLLTKTYNGQCP